MCCRVVLATVIVLMPAAAAGCGGRQAAPRTTSTTTRAAPSPTPRLRHYPGGPATLILTIVDGDTNRRVAHAHVRLEGRLASTDRRGVAVFRVMHRRPLSVAVTASGYQTQTVTERFALSRRATIRIFQPSLQWPLYGATAARTQAQTHIRLRPPFRTIWDVRLGGLIEFPAVVDDGVAYIGNARAQIHAISMRFGSVEWLHDTPNAGMASSPAVTGNSIVYHSITGDVFVLNRATGRLRWSYHVGSPIESSPIVSRGIDYFGTWAGRVYALDLRRRRPLWVRTLGAKITSSAALSAGSLFIGDYAGRVWSLSQATGSTRWTASVNGRIYGTPAVGGGRVFVPSSSGDSLTAFSTTGRNLWRVQTNGYVYSSPALWHGSIFFGSYDGDLYAVSAASGHVRWKVATGGPISGAATVVDGVAYAGSFAHRIIGVDATDGRTVLQFDHGEYAPVSGDGMRLLFHGYSDLYAVAPKRTR